MTFSTLLPLADGTRLRVLESDGSRRPFLLVHGLASNALLWEGVGEVLAAAGHRVIAVDQRGHGLSDQPDGDYGTAAAAGALADRLDLRDAVVAGQSWGGNVVVAFAAARPDVVAGLALVDGGWGDLKAAFPTWEDCEAALRPPALDGFRAEDLLSRMRAGHPDWAEWAIQATAANLRVDDEGHVHRRLTIPHHMQIVRSMWDDPPQRHFAAISVPVVLAPAYGGPRGDAQLQRANEAAAMLANARVHGFPDGDHDLHAQHPDELAADFLSLAKEAG